MEVVVNTSTVVPLLDKAFGVAGHTLGEVDRESWKRNAAQAAAAVQGHPDSARLAVPPEFVVEVTPFGFSVTPEPEFRAAWAAAEADRVRLAELERADREKGN